ncbi:hypothetical protein Ancab_011814 [Ancistrocladus abbreviatus]
MGDLNGEIEKAARKAREFWMALDQKVSKWGNGINEHESSSHNNMLVTSKEVSPQSSGEQYIDGTEVKGTLTPKEYSNMGKCGNNFLVVSNAYRLVGIDFNSLQLEIKSLLESGVSPRQSPPCPKLICDIDYFKKKLPIGGSIFKYDRHSKGYLVGGDFTNDVDARVVGFRKARQILSGGVKDEDEYKYEDEDEDAGISNKVYEFDLLPCSSVNVENLMLEESKHIRGLNGYKSNPMVKKVNGFVYVLHCQPLCRSESGPPKASFERINLESECEEWEALDDPPFFEVFRTRNPAYHFVIGDRIYFSLLNGYMKEQLTELHSFDTTECVWDDGEARNVFSNVERTFTAAGLYPPNGGLSVFRVLDRYHVFVSCELDAPGIYFPLKLRFYASLVTSTGLMLCYQQIPEIFQKQMSPNNFESIDAFFVNLGQGKVAALMSGTTLNLELEGVLCILKFALCVKPEVKAEICCVHNEDTVISYGPQAF